MNSTSLRLSPTLLSNYGFSQGDEFKVSCLEEGKVVLEKYYSRAL
jgi:antitoxin component of MazEF toxin-antitoxin module